VVSLPGNDDRSWPALESVHVKSTSESDTSLPGLLGAEIAEDLEEALVDSGLLASSRRYWMRPRHKRRIPDYLNTR
jgi:hypothetical protein